MRRIAGIALGALLAGCSDPAPTPRDAAAPAATPTAAAAPAAASLPAPSQLHGQVSALSAGVSGLERRVTDQSVVLALAADTLFAFDRADLNPDATTNLQLVADAIRAGAPGDIAIRGYTDSKGGDDYNKALSARRAEAVAGWLRQQVGVRLRTFVVDGRGEAEPVAPNARPDGRDSPEGRARNRRVEIVIPR